MSSQRKVLNISVPPRLERQIERVARQEQKTKSELLRDAFRVYLFYKDWAKIRAWGKATTLKMGIESYDDVERIAG